MKNIGLLIVLIFIFNIINAQGDEYDRGFKNGYKEGYCYGDPNCLSPLVPLTPLPRLNEDTYTDGYNRGFLKGKNDREVGSGNNSGYKTAQAKHINYAYQPTQAELQNRAHRIKLFNKLEKEAIQKYTNKEYSEAIEISIDALNLGFYSTNVYITLAESYRHYKYYKSAKYYFKKCGSYCKPGLKNLKREYKANKDEWLQR